MKSVSPAQRVSEILRRSDHESASKVELVPSFLYLDLEGDTHMDYHYLLVQNYEYRGVEVLQLVRLYVDQGSLIGDSLFGDDGLSLLREPQQAVL